MGSAIATPSRVISAQAATEFLDLLMARYPRRDFQVRLWDGSAWGAQNPCFTLVIKDPAALRQMVESPSELALGEAYIYDDYDIEGNIGAALEFGEYILQEKRTLAERLHLAMLLRKLPPCDSARRGRAAGIEPKLKGPAHAKERDRQAISFHYDLPLEFYRVWLDRTLTYSCAYFLTPKDDLDTAQRRKLDYICRKLRVRRGEQLLDIGCGWGGLVLHAAEHYGVQAMGITLSRRQAEVASERIRTAGLESKGRVEECDYRDIKGTEEFDKIASVGMFEHVGNELLPEYFSRVWTLLKPGGVFLNQGISYSATHQQPKPSFSDTYVFPDGELISLNESLHAAEISGFEGRDVESLREHYVLTLGQWVSRLEKHAEQARRVTNDVIYRVWRLYMAASAARFAAGRTNVYQTLLVKRDRGASRLPLTRADWYRQ